MDDPIRELIELDAVNETDDTGRTALFYVISSREVQTLIYAGADINIADDQGKTPLIYALLYNKNVEVLRALIDAGADVNIADEVGKTALFYAVQQRNNESVVRALIDAGADVNKDDIKGKTALFYAVRKSMIQTFIAAGADPNKADKNGKSILLNAVMKNKEHLALAMIEAGAYVNFVDEDGCSILFYAVMQNSHILIDALVKAGADINKTDQEGKTPLYFAQAYGKENASRTLIQALASEGFEKERTNALFNASSKEEIQALVDCGVDINSTNDKGQSPLHNAILCKRRNLACALIQAGADVNLVADRGAFPLFQACLTNDNELVRVLIDAGADVNKTDISGKNALFYIRDNQRIANSIISAGVDVNAKDSNGKTALFQAVKYNTTHVATAMIEGGADVKTCNANGESLLKLAVINRNESLVRALLNAGADANYIPNEVDSNPPLYYAVLWNNHKVVKMLLKSGADVNVIFDEGKTVLFFALEDAAMVKTLIEDGDALVNVKDLYGRNPLFYAITKSIPTSKYLLEKGAKVFEKDNCNLNILSYYVESRMSEFKCNTQLVMTGEGIDLLLKHGVERDDIVDAIIDVVFRKLLYVSSLHMPFFNCEDGLNAVQLARKVNEVTENTKENLLDNILLLICNEVANIKSFYEIHVPKIISQLIELGANPNSADSDGNTALHHLTRLPFLGVPKDVIMKIYSQLKTFGVAVNASNKQLETPLLFCLSGAILEVKNKRHLSGMNSNIIVDICKRLLEDGANIQQTTRAGESVFHLVMKLFQDGLVQEEAIRERVFNETMKLLALFSGSCKTKKDKGITVNRRDINLDVPLHLWASLSLDTLTEYHDSLLLKENIVFKDFLKLILNYLLSCGARLNDRNAMEETPLHLCRTWSAVVVLIDAGANPNVLDSLGRSPLHVAIERRTFVDSENSFYPDVVQDPYAFWEAALERNLDLWVVCRNGDSVLNCLVRFNSFVLAKALLEVAVDKNYLNSDSFSMDLLNAVCKVRSTMNASWKSALVEMILRSRKTCIASKRNEETPLHFCSRNIVRNFAISRAAYFKSVHWTIVKQLLWYGADPTIPDSNGQSCLDIAESCPALRELLIKPITLDEVPMMIPWLSVSKRYQPILAKTCRRQECEHVESFWYHKAHLQSGTFGLIFAGINEKDGREVAIKRIEKRRMGRREDKREIENLLVLADCEQVVRYLHFFEDEDFSYVVLELMEGDLDEYLCRYSSLNNLTRDQLCKLEVTGLRFLHGRDILHRDLKPTNILYKLSPNLCLKIADFGLSRRINSTSPTVYGTNMGTRCWIAPEILKDIEGHSKFADIFSCGLILHYILSVRRHPFAPSDCANKSLLQIQNETESNVIKGEPEGWDSSLSPEGAHLVGSMLSTNKEQRPSGAEALAHPLFWSKKKKIDLLIAVGNQPEVSCPRAKRIPPLTAVENDLEASFATIVKHVKWNDPGYAHMPVTYTEMTKGRKMPYDHFSAVELVRFIRNAYAHVSESTRPTPIRKLLLEDFVFLEYFPNLVIEVYKAVTSHGWDQTREEIKYALKI